MRLTNRSSMNHDCMQKVKIKANEEFMLDAKISVFVFVPFSDIWLQPGQKKRKRNS